MSIEDRTGYGSGRIEVVTKGEVHRKRQLVELR